MFREHDQAQAPEAGPVEDRPRKEAPGCEDGAGTIERALDLVLGEEPILKAHRRVKAVGGFEDVFR
jgi:hypothetical protein